MLSFTVMAKTFVERGTQTDSLDGDVPRLKEGSFSVLQMASGFRPLSTKSHLVFRQPSFLNSPGERIVSLPETSPPNRFKGAPHGMRASSATQFDINKLQADISLLSETHTESSLSAERASSNSIGSISMHSISKSILRTPSPPSSPESVMIIGNDVHVPSCFFRQPRDTHLQDEDWTSWANSPPKPIPALHGPLSLPYARCPSGAEGTIIQAPGEDLPRMIWGLDTNQASPLLAPPRGNTAGIVHINPNPQATSTVHIQDYRQATRSPILLAQDHLFPRPRFCPEIGSTDSPFDYKFPAQSINSSASVIRPTQAEVPEPFYPPIMKGSEGLGLNISISMADNQRIQPFSTLKPSAPVFVPSNRKARELLPSASVNSHYHSPCLDYNPHNDVPSTVFPTPPSTASPLWTPQLTQQAFDTYEDPYEDDFNASTYDSSEELRNFVLRSLNKLNLKGDGPHSFSFTYQQSLQPELVKSNNQAGSQADPNFSVSSNSANINTRTQSPITEANTYPNPYSNNHSSSRRPRSIPMARLLQRRLAPVPEEDTTSPPPAPRLYANDDATASLPPMPFQDTNKSETGTRPMQWRKAAHNETRKSTITMLAAPPIDQTSAPWRSGSRTLYPNKPRDTDIQNNKIKKISGPFILHDENSYAWLTKADGFD